MPPTSEYLPEETRALVEGYITLNGNRSVSKKRLWLLVRLMDLDQALPRLSPVLRQALFLCGVLGLTYRDAAKAAQVPTMTMHDRYERGLELLTTILNGGDTEPTEAHS